MTQTFVFAWLILLAFTVSTTDNAKTACTSPSFEIVPGTCFYVYHRINKQLAETLENQPRMADMCANLKIGGLRWHLPTMKDMAKRDAFTRYVLANARHEIKGPYYGFMWIDLRRRPSKSGEEDEHWYWASDNSTFQGHTYGFDAWGIGEPNNGRLIQSRPANWTEECVAAYVEQHVTIENITVFRDRPCAGFERIIDDRLYNALLDSNYYVGACEAALINPKNPINPINPTDAAGAGAGGAGTDRPVTKRLWFYILCAGLVVVPIVIGASIFAFYYCKGRRSRRVAAASTSPPDQQQPGSETEKTVKTEKSPDRWRRNGRREEKSKPAQRRLSADEERYEKYADEDVRSGTLDSFQSDPLVKLGQFKSIKGYASPMSKSTDASNAKFGLDEMEDHVYSNVRPNARRKKDDKSKSIDAAPVPKEAGKTKVNAPVPVRKEAVKSAVKSTATPSVVVAKVAPKGK